MQWLIDLVIAAIGVPPVFINRPDTVINDFVTAAFEPTNTWVTLDMSSVVPAGASAVLFELTLKSATIGDLVKFRKPDTTSTIGLSSVIAQVAGLYTVGVIAQANSTDRKIEAQAQEIGLTTITLKIRGWWL